MVIERVRASSGGIWKYDRRNKRRYTRRTWYMYYRVVDNGRIINTFLKKSTATQWVRRQRT